MAFSISSVTHLEKEVYDLFSEQMLHETDIHRANIIMVTRFFEYKS